MKKVVKPIYLVTYPFKTLGRLRIHVFYSFVENLSAVWTVLVAFSSSRKWGSQWASFPGLDKPSYSFLSLDQPATFYPFYFQRGEMSRSAPTLGSFSLLLGHLHPFFTAFCTQSKILWNSTGPQAPRVNQFFHNSIPVWSEAHFHKDHFLLDRTFIFFGQLPLSIIHA